MNSINLSFNINSNNIIRSRSVSLRSFAVDAECSQLQFVIGGDYEGWSCYGMKLQRARKRCVPHTNPYNDYDTEAPVRESRGWMTTLRIQVTTMTSFIS